MRLWFRFLVPLVLTLVLIAYAVVPLVDRMIAQWFQSDLDLRSKLIATSVQSSLSEAVDTTQQLRASSKLRVYFDALMLDQRLYALAFCNVNRVLLYTTAKFPADLPCDDPTDTARMPEVVEEESGPLHVAYNTISGSGGVLGRLILVHDMSFIERRSATTRQYIVLFLSALGFIVAFLTILIAKVSLRGWIHGMRELVRDDSLLRPLAPGSAEIEPLARELRNYIRDLETSRHIQDESQIHWTPRALKNLLQRELAGDEVLVVSNREPYIHTRKGEDIVVEHPASGVVTALEPIMRACGGTWVAHGSGTADRDVVDGSDSVAVPPEHPSYRLRRVWLSAEEEKNYYDGFANEGLWPLCHIAHVRPIFRSRDWEEYRRVNEKFADVIVQEAVTKDPLILVQDYHFALLPKLLRQRLPEATIVTFWHIPWPHAESFAICPWAKDIIEGLLGSTIVGFHTRHHCLNFIETVERLLECQVNHEHWTISFKKQLTAINWYPISIEFPTKSVRRRSVSFSGAADAVRERHGIAADCRIGVGVDRCDYTKGIGERLLAVQRLLELHPEWIGTFTFIQLAAPTRSRIDHYQRFQKEVQALAAKINEKFGRPGYRPVILLLSHHEPQAVQEYYRAADLCFVSSLHDGMNLVAKEFVVAREDEKGVLLLSQFTGASRDLPEALIVNPYHIDDCAHALEAALLMPPEEQRDRMRSMRGALHEFNVYRWAGRMLLDAARIRQRSRFLSRLAGGAPFPHSPSN